MKITMPVGGKDEVINIPDKNINEIIMPVHKDPLPNVEQKIREAVLNPIGTKRLSEIVKEKFGKEGKRGGPYHKVGVCADSFNRPTKHYLLFPPVLEELEKAGIKDKDIVIIEGCGVHRPATPEEWERKWGKELRARFREQMFSHTAPPQEYEKFQSPVKLIGFTKHNCPVSINQKAAESDVLILLGQISMSSSYGYGGGAKMILPGIAGYESIVLSHHLAPPRKRAGGGRWEENEARVDINEMGDVAGVDFIVNAAHNTSGDIVGVAAGHHTKAWASLIPVCEEMYIRPSIKPADIYISSASPRHTLSGAFATDHYWAIGGGKNATKVGGTMIIAHRAVWPQHPVAHRGCPYFKVCEDMIHAMKPRPIDELVRLCYYRIRWESAMIYRSSSVMSEREIVVTGEGYRPEDFGEGFKYIPTFEEAIDYAFKKHGKDATVNIAPFGGRFTYITRDDCNGDFADEVMGPYAAGEGWKEYSE